MVVPAWSPGTLALEPCRGRVAAAEPFVPAVAGQATASVGAHRCGVDDDPVEAALGVCARAEW
ncbi:hypothetical protein [Streptomyces sp. NPDC058457]|uniref:hypothetical protein n=1 Tax=Streptomyces sp. NPDC058457 TaxID=3346507 RepID=UPI0036581E31